MPARRPRHEWLIAPFRADRDAAPRSAEARWVEVDAHRGLRGPYSAAGELVRRLIGEAGAHTPELVERHRLTLVSVAPEALDHVPAPTEVARWLALSREGHPQGWTQRLAHGVTEFVADYAERTGPPRLALRFENVDQADPLDREFLAVLLRRADPERLTVRICSSVDPLDLPLRAALEAHAAVLVPEHSTHSAEPDLDSSILEARSSASVERMAPAERLALARAFVDSDCTSDRPLLRQAYARTPSSDRGPLHRARAATLEASGQGSLALGALPMHHERAGGDVETLLAASKTCLELGYYEAALDWATRGRRLLPATERDQTWGGLSRNLLFSLLLLNRVDEVEAACAENLEQSDAPELLAHTAYARAILHARFYEPSRRDYAAARTWVERSLAYADLLPPSEARAVGIAFLHNTLALVETRQGRPESALRMLTEAMEAIERAAPDGFDVERVLLLHNRARLQLVLRRADAAIEDLTALLRRHPGDAAAHFDRGVLHNRAGRHEDALRDFGEAIRWSPPYPDPHLRRARVLATLGRIDEALADYAYVLELEPTHLEARVDRAWLYYERARYDASRAEVDDALRLAPKHARLLCLRGLLELRAGQDDAAWAAFTGSLEADPGLADAWANRARIRFRRGDLEGAAADLDRALSLREDAAALYNRGRIFEARGDWPAAARDYARAVQLAPEDAEDAQRRLDGCRRTAAPPVDRASVESAPR